MFVLNDFCFKGDSFTSNLRDLLAFGEKVQFENNVGLFTPTYPITYTYLLTYTRPD